MRVCCSIMYRPFESGRKRFDSLAEAKDYFRREVAENADLSLCGEGMEVIYSMMVYPELDADGKPCECDSVCCYHEYPIKLYTVGPRGGVKEEAI